MEKQLLVGLVVGLLVGAAGMHSVSAEADTPDPVVVSQEDAPKRWTPNGKARATLLTRGENAYVGLLKMGGEGKVPEHRDPTEEYLYFLSGSGTMHINDKTYEVEAGSAVYMPSNAKVSFEGHSKDDIEVVQVFAGPGPSKKYEKWETSEP